MAKKPNLSIVLCGRNDQCGGDFKRRCLSAARHNAALWAAFDWRVEWIFVEWNPVADRPLLADSLASICPDLRVAVVPSALHRRIATNASLGLLQFHAKNVGLRLASADWILVLNADTWLTRPLVETLMGALDPAQLHLAFRRDVAPDYLDAGAGRVPIDQWPITHRNEVSVPSNFGPCGDFMLMHRSLLVRTAGYYEGVLNSNCHIDTIFCRKVLALGGGVNYLGEVFHVEHSDSFNQFDGSDPAHHHGMPYHLQHVDPLYENPVGWGLTQVSRKKVGGCIVEWDASDPLPDYGGAAPHLNQLYAQFEHWFAEVLAELKRTRRPAVLWGFGREARRAAAAGALRDIAWLGALDECAVPGWEQVDPSAVDDSAAIVIGSAWWCLDLAERARARGWGAQLEPRALRDRAREGRNLNRG